MGKNMNHYNRRRFLKRGCQAMSTAGLALGANPMLTLARAAETDFSASDDYRALVCVYLQGGSDGFSLFVPTDNGGYQDYANSRKGLAIDRSNLLDLSTQSGPQLGIHSAAAPLQSLFNDGKLAMVSNVGNLIEPTTLQQYEDKSVALPSQLFSHSIKKFNGNNCKVVVVAPTAGAQSPLTIYQLIKSATT